MSDPASSSAAAADEADAPAATDIETKQAQLREYKEQLIAVENALEGMDESHEDYEGLKEAKGDLLEVIGLLENITAYNIFLELIFNHVTYFAIFTITGILF